MMERNFLYYFIIALFIFGVMMLGKFLRKKLAKPEKNQGVQKRGKFDRFLFIFLTMIAIFSALLMVVGFVGQEVEMGIAFAVLTLIMVGALILIRNAHKMTYEENDERFILNMNKKRYEVYYENIIDWLPGFNEIRILDGTRENNKYIRVNIAILKPEILLRNILEQTEKGKFAIVSDFNQEDPLRKNEIINFLASNNYRYLVEDLIEE